MFDRRTASTFNYFSMLNPERRMVIEDLMARSVDPDGLDDILGVEKERVEDAVRINHEIFESPLMSALDRYSPGVLFQATDFENLPTGAQRRLLEHGIIVSSLFGLLRPDDLVPEYYLHLDAALPQVGAVSEFWPQYISPILNELVTGSFVWNLLPDPFSAMWIADNSHSGMATVSYYIETKGKRTLVTDDLLSLQGGFVNLVVREALEDLEGLAELEHPEGFRQDVDATEWDEETKTARVALVRKA
jgi:cytoplasmic iron level regulating protein YaaA (DUF328/UPF0246 family)